MFLMLFLRNIIDIRNRMKRSSSSSAKENSIRNAVAKLSAKKHTNNQHFTSFNSNNSLLAEHTAKYSQTPNPYFQEFYKTFGSSNFGQWSRPQSKQAYRKTGSRPETSKGVRPVEKLPKRWVRESKDIGFYSQYIPEKVSEQIREQLGSHIQIIVTKSHKKGIEEKAPRSKFETDLDDEFLQLFAN